MKICAVVGKEKKTFSSEESTTVVRLVGWRGSVAVFLVVCCVFCWSVAVAVYECGDVEEKKEQASGSVSGRGACEEYLFVCQYQG